MPRIYVFGALQAASYACTTSTFPVALNSDENDCHDMKEDLCVVNQGELCGSSSLALLHVWIELLSDTSCFIHAFLRKPFRNIERGL